MIEGGEKLGQLTAELLDIIEAAELPEGSEAHIRTAAIVIEIERDDTDGEGYTKILTRCTDTRRWLQEGLLEAGKVAIRRDTEAADDEDDD